MKQIFQEEESYPQIISSGSNCVAVVNDSGQVEYWGEFTPGVLRARDFERSSHSVTGVAALRSLNIPEPVRHVSCGVAHILCLTRSGHVYSYGHNRCVCWKLCILNSHQAPLFEKIFHVIVDLRKRTETCGEEIILEQLETVQMNSNAVISVSSFCSHGQCGLGHTENVHVATPIKGPFGPVKLVQAGHYHSALITGDGKAYTWGWSSHGQLGHKQLYLKGDILYPEPLSFR